MGKVINLQDHKPHITIITHANCERTIPVSVFADICKGRKTVNCLEDSDAVVRVIIAEWLEHIGVPDAENLRAFEVEESDGA